MKHDVGIASKGIIDTLRERFAELEHLEDRKASTPDTHEELVAICEVSRTWLTHWGMPARHCINASWRPLIKAYFALVR